MRCAGPSDSKGSHRVKDCKRPNNFDNVTASYPNAKEYQKTKIAGRQMDSSDSESDSEDDSEDDSEENEELEGNDSGEEKSEGEVMDNSEKELEEYKEVLNWWDSDSESD